MEWYTFGLDKMLMFIFATSSATVIVLTVISKISHREGAEEVR